MKQHDKIDYVEFSVIDIQASKDFFAKVFGWTFTDYGSQYTCFDNQGFYGGFFQSDKKARIENGSALIVIYSNKLEETQKQIEDAGGKITQSIFAFPGGRRFHFTEPSGNELAVWTEA